ncbi:uncharacterized protein KY384_007382 [Bacidia gigantensis]|uniref:uncharacterized protein n=1 Tax=Bacidia gigantensis TaxID=2732470 RepID=UPI001D03D0F3|nr:uncharacterized protein KY384_007382 [Bacidia gigantensis]KAG8528464.1 hypothetical protein KY384_007382 [Bacidia gigantensis]
MICAIIYSGLCIGQSKWGLGLDIKLRPKQNIDDYSTINFAGRPFYMFGILGFKVALCFAYLRIMKSSSYNFYRALTWSVMIACIIGHVAGTLVLIFQCKPVQKSWRPRTPGKCMPNDATFYGLAAVTIFFDVVIFFLPIPLLLRLNISMKKKLALVCVFLLGLLTTVCSVLRMVQIETIARTGNSTMLVLWGVIELNIGIILTCIPTLGPLFPYFRGTSIERTPSKPSAYHLSAIGSRTPQRPLRTSHISSNEKYGERTHGTRFSNAGINDLSESSSEDMVRLKDNPAGAGEGIVKKTFIRISVDNDGDVERQSGDGANVARAW